MGSLITGQTSTHFNIGSVSDTVEFDAMVMSGPHSLRDKCRTQAWLYYRQELEHYQENKRQWDQNPVGPAPSAPRKPDGPETIDGDQKSRDFLIYWIATIDASNKPNPIKARFYEGLQRVSTVCCGETN